MVWNQWKGHPKKKKRVKIAQVRYDITNDDFGKSLVNFTEKYIGLGLIFFQIKFRVIDFNFFYTIGTNFGSISL